MILAPDVPYTFTRHVGPGVPMRWCQPIVWASSGHTKRELRSLRRSFRTVSRISGLTIHRGPRPTVRITFTRTGGPVRGQTNLWMYADQTTGVYDRYGAGTIGFLFRSGFRFTDHVILHEVMHAVGLGHAGRHSMMTPNATSNRTRLSPGDKSGLRALGGC